MKKLMILSALALCLTFVGSNFMYAENFDANKSELVGTSWRMVKNLCDSLHHERIMYFKKNFTFESHNLDGSYFNGGRYSIIDANTFVTVHSGAQSANLFHFTIKNDTLHFKGHFVDFYFNESDTKIGFMPIEEIFVKDKSWVDKNEGIQFSEDAELSTALAHSAREGKMIFMDCYTSWCGPCKYLANQIFPMKQVGDFYNKNFINLSFDMETPEGSRIATKYGIRAYPTLLFLNSKGEVEHSAAGSRNAEQMIELGRTAMDTTANMKALLAKIKKGDRSAETLISYLSGNPYDKGNKKFLNDYFKDKTEKERLSEGSWKLFNWFLDDVDNPQFKFFVKHRAQYEKLYGKKAVNTKIMNLLDANVRDSVKYQSLQKVDPTLFAKHQSQMNYRTAFYTARSQKKDVGLWNKMLDASKKFLAQDSIEAYQYNETSWYIYENYKTFHDTLALKQSKIWSEKSLQLLPDEHQYEDTYAHILFELGDVQGAINYEEKAMKGAMAKKSDSVKSYTDELNRFKKSLK